MPEQLELFRDAEVPTPLPEAAEQPIENMTDDELKILLAQTLKLGNVGTYYDRLVETPTGKKIGV